MERPPNSGAFGARLLVIIGLAATVSCGVLSAPDGEAVSQVRGQYFGRDFAGAYAAAGRLLEQHPGSTRLRAWQLLAAAESRRHDAAIAGAEALTENEPDSAWAWVALAGALSNDRGRAEEARAASERAVEIEPADPDVVWMRAQTLATLGEPEDAIVFVDGMVDPPAELLNVKAYALYRQSFGGEANDKAEEALAVYQQARALDPSNVNAHYLAGDMLRRQRRTEEALPLLEEALRLSPAAAQVHSTYWYTVLGLPELSPEEKRGLIDADIAGFLAGDADVPATLLVVEGIYAELGEEELEHELEERLLREFSDRPEAESILIGRFRELRSAASDEDAGDEQRSEYRDALRAFIELPLHHRAVFIGEAYMNLFRELADDPDVDPNDLAEVIRGMIKYEQLNPHITFVEGAVTLADRTGRYREAEQIARDGMDAARRLVESRRRSYDTEGDYENALNYYLALMHDAQGQVFHSEGRLDDAETAFLEAHELNPRDRDNLYHLGQLAEARGNIVEAERYYIQGLAVQRPGENPCETALKDLYAERHGSLEGFDAYLAGVEDAERADRKAEILEDRVDEPQPAPDFDLTTLEGSRLGLDDLKGKVVVVNFWGIWCGWCVIEMPDLQKLHAEYADDPEVVIVTINNDTNPDQVPPWMEEQGYSFPVLLDDGYVSGAAGVSAFPTTWFLDREGRICFNKRGWSQELIEEFTWRIEDLRTDRR